MLTLPYQISQVVFNKHKLCSLNNDFHHTAFQNEIWNPAGWVKCLKIHQNSKISSKLNFFWRCCIKDQIKFRQFAIAKLRILGQNWRCLQKTMAQNMGSQTVIFTFFHQKEQNWYYYWSLIYLSKKEFQNFLNFEKGDFPDFSNVEIFFCLPFHVMTGKPLLNLTDPMIANSSTHSSI